MPNPPSSASGANAPHTPDAPTDNLFFAVFPDPLTAERVAALTKAWLAAHRLEGRPVAAARLHVSIRQIGLYSGLPEAVVAAAREAASQVAMPPFTVEFNALATFGGRSGPQPLVLHGDEGVVGLEMLRDRLSATLAAVGLGGPMRPYTPHMTVAYGALLPRRVLIDPIRWAVGELCLVHSVIGKGRYVRLAHVALHG